MLEAISMAGDLSIYGKRDAVFVIREENGERVTHWADLRSKEVFNSPVYYLKQNDVIYVKPTKAKVHSRTFSENSSMWITLLSLVTSITSFVIAVSN